MNTLLAFYVGCTLGIVGTALFVAVRRAMIRRRIWDRIEVKMEERERFTPGEQRPKWTSIEVSEGSEWAAVKHLVWLMDQEAKHGE